MMDEGKIAAISIPFAAGVVLGQFFLPDPGLSFAVTTVLTGLILLADSGYPAYAILFVSLGLTCCRTSEICGPPFQLLSSYAHRLGLVLAGKLSALPFPHEETSGILGALLLGDRNGVEPRTADAFRTAGASHILALSGLHLGIIYGIISKPFSILGKSMWAKIVRSLTVCAGTSLYTVMTGASPSTVRALIFIINKEAARLMPDRKGSNGSIWLTALFIQLVIQPTCIGTLGFQLSYLATASIFLLAPRLRAWYPGKAGFDPFHKIWDTVSITVSCQLFTAPLIWAKFHTFPAHFLIANLISLPLSTASIAGAAVTLLLDTALPSGCPGIIIRTEDALVRSLTKSLETISAL